MSNDDYFIQHRLKQSGQHQETHNKDIYNETTAQYNNMQNNQKTHEQNYQNGSRQIYYDQHMPQIKQLSKQHQEDLYGRQEKEYNNQGFDINQIKIPANIPYIPPDGNKPNINIGNQNIMSYNYQFAQIPPDRHAIQPGQPRDVRLYNYDQKQSPVPYVTTSDPRYQQNKTPGQVQKYYMMEQSPQQAKQRPQQPPLAPKTTQQQPNQTQQQPQPYVPQIIKFQNKGVEYRVCEKLGRGGFANVYKGINVQTNEEVAIKVVSKAQCQKNKVREKLLMEIRIHKQLQHPHICQLKDSCSDDYNFYIVLELCQFNNLNNLLKEKGSLSVDEIQYFTYQLLLALNYLKQHKIIHRDIKSQNVLIKAEPGDGDPAKPESRYLSLKIADFGLSAQLQSSFDIRQTFCGTPNFLAPETLISHIVRKKDLPPGQLEQNIDQETIKMVSVALEQLPWLASGHGLQSDMWSVGCLIYQMATGRPPFETDKIASTYKKIIRNEAQKAIEMNIKDECLKELISNLLVSDPKKRWSVEQALQSRFMAFIKLKALYESYLRRKRGAQKVVGMPNYQLYNSQINVMFPNLAYEQVKKLSVAQIINRQTEIQLQQSQYKQMLNKIFLHYSIRDSNVNIDKLKPILSIYNLMNPAVIQNVRDMTIQEVKNNCLQNQIDQYNLFIAKIAAKYEQVYEDQSNNQISHMFPVKQSVHFFIKKQKHIYVSKWLEKSKYGLAYMLNNRCYGVMFNDSTYLIQSPHGIFFDYYDKTSDSTIRFRSAHIETFVGSKKKQIFQYFKDNLEKRDTGNGETYADTFDIFLDQFMEALYEQQVASKYAQDQRFNLPGFMKQGFQQKSNIDTDEFLNACKETLEVIQGQGVYGLNQNDSKVSAQSARRNDVVTDQADRDMGKQIQYQQTKALQTQSYQYKHQTPYNITYCVKGHRPDINNMATYEINHELLKRAIQKYVDRHLSQCQDVYIQLQRDGYFSMPEITNDLYEQLQLVYQYPLQYVYGGSVQDPSIAWFKLSQNVQQYNLNTHEKLIYYNMYGELAFFNAQRHGVVAELKQFKALNLKDFADIETSVQDYSLRPLGY